MSARTTALSVLIACRKGGAWSDGALKDYIRRDKLDSRDAGLCTALCLGVLQNRALLDYDIDLFLKGSRKDLQPVVLDILRLAVCQLRFLSRIPPSAAVNEAVEQAKRYAGKPAAGLVNGVLRTMVREPERFVSPTDLATRYSHPQALIDLLQESVGTERLEAILAADNTPAATCVQVNPLRATVDTLASVLGEQGVKTAPHPWLEGCLLLSGTGDLERLPAFQTGLFQVQDAAANLAVRVLELKPGQRVLDLCAAPGGKSCAAAMAMGDCGEIVACDIHEKKLRQVTAAAARLGLSSISTEVRDGRVFCPAYEKAFDVVIADVPCSGLGVIRKKPDIRYKDLSQLVHLPEIQLALLKNAAAYVRPGGLLLYSTCTILGRENEDVAARFLEEQTRFIPESMTFPPGLGRAPASTTTLYQGIDRCDGFFLCKLRASA